LCELLFKAVFADLFVVLKKRERNSIFYYPKKREKEIAELEIVGKR
jgi:hypothetical protein